MSNQISESQHGSFFDYYEQSTNNIYNSFQTGVSTSATPVILSFRIPAVGVGIKWDMNLVGENLTTPNASTSGIQIGYSGSTYIYANGTITVGIVPSAPTAGWNIGSGSTMTTIPTVTAGAQSSQLLLVTVTGAASTTFNFTVQMKFIPSVV